MTDSDTTTRRSWKQRVREQAEGEDFLSAVVGMLTAIGTLIFLGALIAAGQGGIDYQLNAIQFDGTVEEVEAIGAIVAILVVFASFFVGGFAAGRISLSDGARNGLGSAILFTLLVAVFAALGIWVGEEYNAFGGAGLPDWFSQVGADDAPLKAIVAAAALVLASLMGGYLGGQAGERWTTEELAD